MTEKDVLITDELWQRTPLPVNWEAENRILRDLGKHLTNSPDLLLKHFSKIAKELCQAGSAGVSLIEETNTGKKLFRWAGLAGAYEGFEGGTTPYDFSPCGVCLRKGRAQLYHYPDRYFTYLQEPQFPVIVESLVVPLVLEEKQMGTIWIVSHSKLRQFNPEDLRVMTSLSEFLAGALANALMRQAIEETARLEQVARIDSEEKFRQMAETIEVVFWMSDGLEPKITYVSPAYERIWGRNRQKLYQDFNEYLESIYIEDRDMVVKALSSRLLQESFESEYRIVRPDGCVRWVQDRGFLIKDDNGTPYRLVGFAQDITDRKQTELLRTEQKKLLELIASGRPLDDCLAFVCTAVSTLNPGTRACILLTDAEGLTFPRSIAPDHPPSFGEGVKDAPINELAIGTCGTAVYCGNPVTCADIAHDKRWSKPWRDLCIAHGVLACHSQPVFGVNHRPFGSVMLCFNEARMPTDWEYQLAEFGAQVASIVFERERASLALRESEERFRNMADNAPVMVWLSDADGYCTYLSKTWYNFCGQTEETGLGFGWLNAIHPEDRELTEKIFQQTNHHREKFQLEYRLRRFDGEYRTCLDSASPWFGADRKFKGYIGSAMDITDRKQAALQLEQQAKKLASLNESLMQTTEVLADRNFELNSFTYMVSHDLKAPLRAISNLSQWLEEDLEDQLDEKTQYQMLLLRNRVKRMEAIIDGLLAYSRVGRTKIEPQRVDVGLLLEEILDSLELPPTFIVKIASDMPSIFADRLLLSQVFFNLIGNGIKHHPRPDGQIEITAIKKGEFYEFAVADDGDGIAQQHHDKIFRLFQTLKARDVKESSGVGLSIAKKIVESQGGKIILESDLGKGSTFRFTWALQPIS